MEGVMHAFSSVTTMRAACNVGAPTTVKSLGDTQSLAVPRKNPRVSLPQSGLSSRAGTGRMLPVADSILATFRGTGANRPILLKNLVDR